MKYKEFPVCSPWQLGAVLLPLCRSPKWIMFLHTSLLICCFSTAAPTCEDECCSWIAGRSPEGEGGSNSAVAKIVSLPLKVLLSNKNGCVHKRS